MTLLESAEVSTRLPAQDLERARAFYAEKLGLESVEEREGGLRYRCGSGYFAVFQSAGTASGDHTQMALEVEDIESVVAELRRRGVVFEEVDVPACARSTASPTSRAITRPKVVASGARGSATAKGTWSASANPCAEGP